MWLGWCDVICPEAAAMLEYRLALGFGQYDDGDGNMLPENETNST